jgi:hypothetical protein
MPKQKTLTTPLVCLFISASPAAVNDLFVTQTVSLRLRSLPLNVIASWQLALHITYAAWSGL